uniref:Uncharacterized protein n=1 Tax=Cacopsylla melanoneura TaxID=428564 RepID=A0A8D8W417_9HEMI
MSPSCRLLVYFFFITNITLSQSFLLSTFFYLFTLSFISFITYYYQFINQFSHTFFVRSLHLFVSSKVFLYLFLETEKLRKLIRSDKTESCATSDQSSKFIFFLSSNRKLIYYL